MTILTLNPHFSKPFIVIQASVKKTALPKAAPVKTQTQILDLECDNLADQVFLSAVFDV